MKLNAFYLLYSLSIIAVISIYFAYCNDVNPESNNFDEENKEDSKPISITKQNFMDIINEAGRGTFVMYYAGWCGHCKRVMRDWNKMAQRYNPKKRFYIAKVDCTVEIEFCSDNDILGYPTFVFKIYCFI
jgi:thiol-disulfide isomerase/thioredoxin